MRPGPVNARRSCADDNVRCKAMAAVMAGVGARMPVNPSRSMAVGNGKRGSGCTAAGRGEGGRGRGSGSEHIGS